MSEISNVTGYDYDEYNYGRYPVGYEEELVEASAPEAEQEIVQEKVAEVADQVLAATIENEQVAEEVQETAPAAIEVAAEATSEKVVEAPKAQVQVKVLPELKLRSITRKELSKKDFVLVAEHIAKNVKNIQWDKARNVVIIEKSGKTRAYQIGKGGSPALIERKNRKEVLNFLKNMKA